MIPSDAAIELTGGAPRYVGRGGLKLDGALEDFGIDPEGKICLDAGCSTGGFTDCLLQHGAARVYAVDVTTSQLAWKLRQDARVIPVEANVRFLGPKALPEQPVAGDRRCFLHFRGQGVATTGGGSSARRGVPHLGEAAVRAGARRRGTRRNRSRRASARARHRTRPCGGHLCGIERARRAPKPLARRRGEPRVFSTRHSRSAEFPAGGKVARVECPCCACTE